MRLIIAGSRRRVELILKQYSAVELVDACLVQVGIAPSDVAQVLSGKAEGGDRAGELWAEHYGIPVADYPARWKVRGILDVFAGRKRNRQMAANADALLALWDGTSSGTRHMIQVARGLRRHVFIVDLDERGGPSVRSGDAHVRL